MRVIDAHVHLYPPEANRDPAAWAAARGEVDWALMCARRRKSGVPVQTFPSVDELLREMDRAQVARSLLLGWYWLDAATCAEQNSFFAECVRAHPDRLSAFATVQPRDGAEIAQDEVHRAAQAGLSGLGELCPPAQGYEVDGPEFGAVLGAAAEYNWPVNLHVTDPDGRDYPGRVETPLDQFLWLASTWPQLDFVLAHWGGLLPLRDAAARTLPNLFYDTAASPLLYDEGIWQRFLAVVPADHVWFGSDFPLNNYPAVDAVPAMDRLINEAQGAGVPVSVLGENVARRLDLR
jgi:predicted TIM-barrel fold metal-dependent hydrolase